MILFETLNQPYILMWLTLSGFLSGIFYDISDILTFLCNNNKIVKNIFSAIATILSFFVLYIVNLLVNYGQFRIYVFVVFFLFLLLEQITLGKVIAKTKDWCYNIFKKITKVITKEKNGKRKKA